MSFPRATEMFQFTRFASHTYVFSMRYPEGWVSPFRNLRIKAYLPAPRSLSQAITSFVAYHCQGIHHMLLFTWPYNFELSFEIKVKSRNCQVLHLTRYAVIELSFIYFLNFQTEVWIFMWRNQKIVADGTVCTKPLRMCTFHQQRWFDSMNF